MVYIIGHTGQLCNQLFRFAHHAANALAHDYSVNNLAFSYSSSFPSLQNNKQIKLTEISKNANKIGQKLITKFSDNKISKTALLKTGTYIIDNKFTLEANQEDFLKHARNRTVLAVNWLFRDYENFNKFSDEIRSLFLPKEDVINRSREKIEEIRLTCDILVGIHVRRGDYISFNDGKYFYEDHVYYQHMKNMEKMLPNKKVSFLLCSNEDIEVNNYKDINIVSHRNPFMNDLTLLSYCDYIVGPPSTFSLWASFMGNIPYYHINDRTAFPSINDFQFVRG
ncbi:alpha-1,2-fucosyltransferase [Spirosoma sordidisoli]|uniref:Alpha-1,2-fucosyltransferase n=1 Tax=Spirosoma sordidisoli TaxID=2502893 RepID=A0A4Q2UPR5_9BACT|nr:alpha-1,2-fucosyltransferase [Spirosoma sordidisoli]RYC71474.1 hypothetical protein EQG79_04845 [Spirosoma sordidisoli]